MAWIKFTTKLPPSNYYHYRDSKDRSDTDIAYVGDSGEITFVKDKTTEYTVDSTSTLGNILHANAEYWDEPIPLPGETSSSKEEVCEQYFQDFPEEGTLHAFSYGWDAGQAATTMSRPSPVTKSSSSVSKNKTKTWKELEEKFFTKEEIEDTMREAKADLLRELELPNKEHLQTATNIISCYMYLNQGAREVLKYLQAVMDLMPDTPPEKEEKPEPHWVDGVPWCMEAGCSRYDGKRCELLGHRPESICTPAVQEMALKLKKLGK